MKLVITNLLQNSQTELDLEERTYVIGRDVDNDIVLDNFFVSKRQAVFKYERGLAGIRPVGSAKTSVNGEPLPNQETRLLKADDEIEIGQYVLTLRESKEVSEETQVNSNQEQLHDLERGIHAALIERLDLRKLDPSSVPSGQYRQMVEELVDALIDEKTPGIDASLVEYVTCNVLRDAISLRHMEAVKKGASLPAPDRAASGGARSFDGFEARVYQMAVERLSADRKRPVDCEELEKWVETNYNEFRYELMTGVKSQTLRTYLKTNILNTVFGFGPLEELLKLPNITEIMVVSHRLIYVEKNGVIQKTGRQFVSEDVALSIIERIVSPLGLRVDRSRPLVDARLPDGSRVNIIIPPLALKGPCITIRKFSKIPLTMQSLISDKHALTAQVAEFLRCAVIGRKNLLISGGTGAGKTTLLNCLSEYIPGKERIITIEDSAELQLKQEHVVTLESRPPNMQGQGAYTIRDLVKNALRMRPDRVIVGECRGAEALDMLQAMNTGHDGSMTTGHANSPPDMLRRLETMVLTATDMPIRAIREQISSAIDIIVQYTRFGDGTRKVTRISEVVKLNPETGDIIVEDIFAYQYSEGESTGSLKHTGYMPVFFPELVKKGIVSLNLLFDSEKEA